MRNFLVAKFKDNLPKTTSFGIKNYKEEDLDKEFGETEILLPSRLYKGILMNYKYSVDRAYKKIGNKPKFHKYNPNKQSFYLPSRTYNVVKGTIPMPHNKQYSVKGKSKIVIDSQYINKFNIKEVKEPRYHYIKGKWFITGAYEIKEPERQSDIITIGLDWGIKNFMTSSKSEVINYPKKVIREFYRINKLKSLRDRKIKNSNNWSKINNKISKAYERFENLKKDFIEQTTTRLCRRNNIAIEDLTNAKIKMSNKRRRRLIQINPLSRFIEKLKWKCQKFGTEFYEVNPAYTSQTCSCCGYVQEMPLNKRIFNCPKCNLILDRDINAAINIAAKATCNSL